MNDLPRASVIIPVLNAERDIRTALTTLLAMDYPRVLLEIIVVDNGSRDRTRDVVREFPVTLLVEESAKNAYTARNAAIRKATGEIIAFTDGDCIIDRHWLRAAVGAMRRENAALVAGNIVFAFPEGKTAGCIVDSVVNLRNDQRVPRRGCAVTANLVVKASLFTSIGLFPDVEPVAGDIIWTATASHSGNKIVYAADAIVHHPARGFRPLLYKTISIARVYAYQQRETPGAVRGRKAAQQLLWSYLPPNPVWIWRILREKEVPRNPGKLFSVWCVMYMHSICRATAALVSFLNDGHREHHPRNVTLEKSV